MESTTYIKNVYCSPKKVRFIADEIRRMTPEHAQEHLYYTTMKPARMLHSAIKSAITNATSTLKTEVSLLQFKAIIIEEGRVLKRFRPAGRGGIAPRKKKYSHIKIVLKTKDIVSAKTVDQAEVQPEKAEVKELKASKTVVSNKGESKEKKTAQKSEVKKSAKK